MDEVDLSQRLYGDTAFRQSCFLALEEFLTVTMELQEKLVISVWLDSYLHEVSE